MNFYLLSITLTINILSFFILLDFPPSRFAYITNESNSIDKSLNIPPPIRPYAKQNPLPLSIDTTSNVFLQTLSSSSNVIVHTNPTTNQNVPPSTSQTTTTTANLSTSHTLNQYTTLSYTPPVIPSNNPQLPVYQIPTIPPIPLSLKKTFSTQPQTRNSPIYFPQNPSLIIQNHHYPYLYRQIFLFPNLLPLVFRLHHITPMSHFTHPGFQTFPTNSFNLLILLLIFFHHQTLHYPLILLLLTFSAFSNDSFCSLCRSLRPYETF